MDKVHFQRRRNSFKNEFRSILVAGTPMKVEAVQFVLLVLRIAFVLERVHQKHVIFRSLALHAQSVPALSFMAHRSFIQCVVDTPFQWLREHFFILKVGGIEEDR